MTDGAPGLVPPSPAPDDAVLDRALADTKRAHQTVVASVATAINGCLLILQALQLFYFIHLFGAYALVPPALLVLGIVLLTLASKLYAQRTWAATGAAVVSGAAAAGVGAFGVLLFLSGLLPLLTEVLPFVLAAGAVLAIVAIGPCQKTTVARKKAAAAGLDLDF